MNTSPPLTSPPISLGQRLPQSSSPTKSQSSGSNSDVDSAMGERRPCTRQSKPRSRNGCWTCRQRKVKCDETRPKCGSCLRLSKDCEWGQRWKFDDLSIRTRRRHKHVSIAGSPSWDDNSQQLVSVRQLYPRRQPLLPPFAQLSNEDEREKKALTQSPGTYNVILTPYSFRSLPEYGGLIRRYRRASGAFNCFSQNDSSEDPNLIFLSEFEDTPYFMALPDRKSSINTLGSQSSCPSSPTLPDSPDDDAVNVDFVMTHYQGFITKRMMPLGSRFALSGPGNEDAIVQESRSFAPVCSDQQFR
jgi:hypothetical protein